MVGRRPRAPARRGHRGRGRATRRRRRRIGDVLFTAGTVVRPAVAGVLASVNAATVLGVSAGAGGGAVDRRRAGRRRFATAGRSDPREQPDDARRRCSTRPAATVVDLGIVRDDEEALEAVLRDAAARCDAIVTSGGVSMGDYDVVKAVLGRIADMHWMQIAIKPAKPFAFGTIDGTPIFGLPGNPVSSMVSFEMIARPALRKMMGHPSPSRTAGRRCRRRRSPPPGRRQDPSAAGQRRRSGTTGGTTSGPSARRAAISWRRRPRPMRSWSLPDGDGVVAGADVDVVCC